MLAVRILRTRRLARIVRTRAIAAPFPTAGAQDRTLTNSNPLLVYGYPGTIGVKTGYTEEAGDCLVAAAQRGGVTLGAVLLHSPAPGSQARNLFDWAFTPRLPPAARPLATLPARSYGTDAAAREWLAFAAATAPRVEKGAHPVDLDDTPEQAAYRAKVRRWIEEHRDEAPVLRGRTRSRTSRRSSPPAARGRAAWPRPGLAGVTWPKEFGGQGLGPIEQVIVTQEISEAGIPGILDAIGVGMLGPTIIAHGSEEQKTKYLPPLLHGDEVWCQLFSEPAAGSDLAAVQTRARQEDDGSWRLTARRSGRRTPSSPSYGLLLARTDPDVPKHKGLTMFIVPMDAEGVTIRGLRQISGEAEFNEVFFDDVKLPADAVVGGVGNGWGTALTTLMYERVTIGLGGEGFGYSADRFRDVIAADPVARRTTRSATSLASCRPNCSACASPATGRSPQLQRGQIPGPEAGPGEGDDRQLRDPRRAT